MRTLLLLTSLALWGCKGDQETDTDAPDGDSDAGLPDADGDGIPDAEDCDDADEDVHPGAPEVWYDGVDQDCDGANDYDQDRDGFVPDAWEAASGLPGGDCDDEDADANPSLVEHVWYDGQDRDCAGDDDWDRDEDGWQHGADDAAREAYAAHYGYDLPDAQWGDCDDLDPDVNPGAVDDWYDGVDTDCDGADDYDLDGDGHRHDAHGGDDCDDTDPTVHPGAADAFGDDVDSDCSGTTFAAIETGGWTYTQPRNVVAVKDDDRYLLVTAADTTTMIPTLMWPAVALWWTAPAAAPDDAVTWHNPVASSAGEIGDRVAAEASGGGFRGTVGYTTRAASVDYSYLAGKRMNWSGAGYDAESLKVTALRDTADLAADVDLLVDGAWTWFLGCSSGHLWWLGLNTTSASGSGTTDLYGGDTCFLESITTAGAVGTVCDGAVCARYDLDATGTIALSSTQPWTVAYTQANRRGDQVVLVEPDGGITLAEAGVVTHANVLSEVTDIRDVDVAWHDGTVFIALTVGDRDSDGLGDVLLAWGTPDALDTAVIPFDDGAVVRDAQHVSVFVDDDVLFLAISGDDGIGWSFTPR